MTRKRSPVSTSGASRSPSRISMGVVGATRCRFSRASAAAAGDCSTATILSNRPPTARDSAMQPPTVVPETAAQTSGGAALYIELFLLLRLLHGRDQIVELPVQHLVHAVGGEMDAMVGHAVLRKVVRADFL